MEGPPMLSNSVNTNAGAMVALQNLNATNMELSQTQIPDQHRQEGRQREG
jgi:hypothetical protein